MVKGEMMYEGKAKKVYAVADDDKLCIVDYKDDATAFNGQKKGTIVGKGVVNNRMSNMLFRLLEAKGVKTHFVKELSERETLVKKVKIVPLEVIVRNIAAGSLSKKLGIPEGTPLKSTVLEFCYKDDDLGDPMVNEYHILAAGYASKEDIDTITKMAFQVNEVLVEFFKTINIELVDFKLEFGYCDGEIIWRTKFRRIPAVCGTSTPTKSWIRTVSVGIWAA